MIRLINPLKEWPVLIDGTEVVLRQMNWADYLQMLSIAEMLSDSFKKKQFDRSTRIDLNRILKEYIVRVDLESSPGVPMEVGEFVERLTFTPSQKISTELIRISSLKEDDRKNSEDSSSSEISS